MEHYFELCKGFWREFCEDQHFTLNDRVEVGYDVYWIDAGSDGGAGCTQREQAPGGTGWNVVDRRRSERERPRNLTILAAVLHDIWWRYGSAYWPRVCRHVVASTTDPRPPTHACAFVAGNGFLMGVVWALIMLMPARLAPSGSFLLIAECIGGGACSLATNRSISARQV